MTEIINIWPTERHYLCSGQPPDPMFDFKEQLRAIIDSGREIVSVVPDYEMDHFPNQLPTPRFIGYIVIVRDNKGGA